MPRLRLCLLLVVLAACVLAASAGAATVRLATERYEDSEGRRLVDFTFRLAAAPGEANRVSVVLGRGGYRVRDRGAVLRPGKGCAAQDGGWVACAVVRPPRHRIMRVAVDVRLGDRDDRAAVALDGPVYRARLRPDETWEYDAEIRGEAGRDRLMVVRGDQVALQGGAGDDVLVGGPRRELLQGGDGRDLLRGRGGTDVFEDDSRGADVVDGGPGRDELDLSGRDAGVTVDLRRTGPQAGLGGDAVRRVEDVTGTSYADTLVGDGHANWFDTAFSDTDEERPPPDVVAGGAGDDTLIGDASDSLDGGAGDDLLGSSTGAPAKLACGGGRDVVGDEYGMGGIFTTADLVPGDCELVGTSAGFLGPRPARTDAGLRFQYCRFDSARTTIRVFVGDVLVAEGHPRLAHTDEIGETKHCRRVTVPLTDAGRAALPAGAHPEAMVLLGKPATDPEDQDGYRVVL